MDIRKLRAAVKGHVVNDLEALQDVFSDFGRLAHRSPAVIVVPSDADDVRRVVELANDEGWTVSTRGAGHSQSGQSLSQEGALIDVMGLARIGPLEEECVWADAGVVWADLVTYLLHRGYVPPVFTNNLNVTVGGTVSLGGLGVASHRYGTQADNVVAMEVVTGAGDLVTCSKEENHELFDSVRCGLGQFGVITRLKLKVRRYSPHCRTHYLLYDDLEALMADNARIVQEQRFDFIEGWCAPCVQGMRTLGDARVPFAEWFHPVHLTLEYTDGVIPTDSLLSGLKYYRKIYVEDTSLADFLRRMEPVFQIWHESGSWRLPHPWMEVILPWDRAGEYIQGVLKSFPPTLLEGGQVLLWPFRGDASGTPMFVHPEGDLAMGFGIHPAVPRKHLGMALSLLNKASDLVTQVGGKRYLSGWVEFDHSRWKAHYGSMWPKVLEWKRFFDPNGVLNPGFVKYQDS
jgi:cytokinin dehydrogenase